MGKKTTTREGRPTGKEKFPKAPRPKQTQLPGTEDNHDAELSALALDYVEARDYRMQLTTEEVKAKTALLAKMADRKLAVYHDPVNALCVEVVPVTTEVKLKVTVEEVERGEGGPHLPTDEETDGKSKAAAS